MGKTIERFEKLKKSLLEEIKVKRRIFEKRTKDWQESEAGQFYDYIITEKEILCDGVDSIITKLNKETSPGQQKLVK